MKSKLFRSACAAAAHCVMPGLQWTLYYGDPCDRMGLANYAACLDQENPLSDENSFYVALEDGSFGITLDRGEHVLVLAEVTVPELEEELLPLAETPGMVITGEVKTKLRSLRRLFTLKGMLMKAIFTGLFMLIAWIGTMLWQRYSATHGGGSPLPARIIAYLTFANAGVSHNYFYMLGGFVGKTFVMGTLMAIVLGGFKKVGRGWKNFVYRTFRLNSARVMGLYLTGMGVACVLYNFFVGEAVLSLSMAGIAGFLSMLWAMGGGIHFIRRMTVALTAHVNPQTRIHYENMERAVHVLSGMAYGFLLSIGLSATGWPFTPYVVGAMLLIVGLIMTLASKRPARTFFTAVLLAMFFVPTNAKAANDKWELTYIRTETVENPNHKGNHNAYVKENPPKILQKNLSVKVFVSDKCKNPKVFWALNCDKDNYSKNPPYGQMKVLNLFEDENTYLRKNGKPAVSYGNGKKAFINLMTMSMKERNVFYSDGTEVALVFQSEYGETRWIYCFQKRESKSRSSEGIPKAGSNANGASSSYGDDDEAEAYEDGSSGKKESGGNGGGSSGRATSNSKRKSAAWSLHFLRAENLENPDNNHIFYEEYTIAAGRHSCFEPGGEDYRQEAIDGVSTKVYHTQTTNVRTCTAPPRIINSGDKISLTVTNNALTTIALGWNVDDSGNANPKYDEFCAFHYLEDASEHSQGDTYSSQGTRTVSYTFGNDPLGYYPPDYSKAPDGAQFVIVFNSDWGETRWIYEYKIGETDESGYGGTQVGPSEDTPGEDYEGMTDEEMAGAIAGAAIAAGAGLAAGAAGASGGGGGGGVPPRPSDPYVRRDEDGNVIYTSPTSGETEILPPDTDEEWLRGHVETVLDNPDYFGQAQKQHDQWAKDQHDKWQQHMKDRAQRGEWADRVREHRQNLKEKYGAEDDDQLRRALIKERGEGEAEYWKRMGESDIAEGNYHLAKDTKQVADVAMDGLAAVTGEQGATINKVYKATSEVLGQVSKAHYGDGKYGKALVVGVTNAGVGYVQDKFGDASHGKRFTAAVVGEAVKDGVGAIADGKGVKESLIEAAKGAGRGIENFTVDTAINSVTKKIKGPESASGAAAPEVPPGYGSFTKDNVTDSLGGMTGDVVKNKADDLYGELVGADEEYMPDEGENPSLKETLKYTKRRIFG